MRITFPDGSGKDFQDGVTPWEVARSISPGLAKSSMAAKAGETLWDLNRPLTGPEVSLKLLTTKDLDNPDLQWLVRHSAAHVMAEAICTLWPETRLVYGPPVENGFYYDLDLERPITEEDFPAIEKEMARIVKENRPFRRAELSRAEALPRLQAEGNPYKVDNAERAEGDVISFYRSGDQEGCFEDLCAGPHVPATGAIGAFKLMSVSGAYWHGDASQPMLQRVYGTAWPSKEQLAAYLHQVEEARRRDHRVLGKQLDLFSVNQEIGPGLILWHPKGAMVRHQVETFWRAEHLQRGYQLTYTPHIASCETYKRSGHLEKYKEMMYNPMNIDGVDYYVKPMNCPGHIQIFKNTRRSYRELPLRYCELGTVYRYEPSGTLHGMLRVRGFTQDDSHIFCTIDQLPGEIAAVLDLVEVMMKRFGYTFKAFLATRPEQSLGTDEEWAWATGALRKALEMRGLAYEVDEGGGVFYAPKIDIKLRDSIGREWQGPTIQVDLNLPKRFDVSYIGADNTEHQVVIVHRTVLGSMERFVGGLIEHYAGNFPLWLAPEQVRVLSISEKFAQYAEQTAARLRTEGFRTGVDAGDDKIGAKIRTAHLERVPYMLILGQREADAGTVNVRRRGSEEQRSLGLAELLAELKAELAQPSV